MDELEAQLLAAVQARTGRSPALADDLTSLGIDSVQMAAFISELEKHFGIRVDEEVFDVQTLIELAQYIRERQGGVGH